jgi:hypothetical protein
MSAYKPVNPNMMNPRWTWLYTLGGSASLILLTLFVIGITGIGAPGGQLAFLQNNWLVVLFKLNIQDKFTQTGMLNILNLLDLVIMILFGLLFLSLYLALHHTHRVWSAIAASLPFLGIPLFLVTHTAGRSALLIGALIFSAIMFGSRVFSNAIAGIGVVASALLFFAGDIGTAILPPSIAIAVLISIGYVLWIIWFVLMGWRLFQLSRRNMA